jgi:outer membrane lipoprotein-sorting protein
MGTDFSYEDIAQTKYAEDYSANILEEKDNHYLLELSPKPDSDVDYSKLTMLVNKETYVYEKIEHYDKNDKLSKVLIASKVKKVDDYWMPMNMEMQDVRKNHRTTMAFSEVKHDTALADKVFSQRYLKRY